MANFNDLMLRGILNWKDVNRDTEADTADCFRGSNTPLLHNGDFVADSSSHCPRIAMMRRAHLPTDYDKTFKDWASHMYGRAMEEYVKKLIVDANVEGLETAEEEGFAAKLEVNGKVIYSARPDLVIFMHGKPEYVCEFKSVQSNSTAEQIFADKMPKLGAAVQCGAQMAVHEINRGLIAYVLGHWIQGYSFSTKKSFKLEPGFISFPCYYDANGVLIVNEKETIVTRTGIESGISLLNDFWNAGTIPSKRPVPMKLNGTKMPYNICDYCAYGSSKSGVCDRADSLSDGMILENFTDIVKEAFVL